MGKHDLGNKDIHKDAAALAVLLNGKVGGGGGGGNQPNWIPALVGWNATTSAIEYLKASVSGFNGIQITQTERILGYGSFITPTGWTGTFYAYAIFRSVSGTGDFYVQNDIQFIDYFGSLGPAGTGGGLETIAIIGSGGGAYKSAAAYATITGQALVRLKFQRWGASAPDTANADAYFLGWEIVYV